MKSRSFCVILAVAAMPAFAFGQAPKKTVTPAARAVAASEMLTNKGIIAMTTAELGDDLIITKIHSSTCKFDVSADGLIALKTAGVSSNVIKNMMAKAEGKVVAATPAGSNDGTVTSVKKVSASGLNAELMNHVYIVNKSDNSSKPLEKVVAGIRTKQGFMSGASMLQVDGAKSGMRQAADQPVTFVVNTGGGAPELILYKVKSVKGKREVASMKVSSFSGVKTGEDVITFDVAKLQDGLYQITPSKTLAAGEYFFTGKPVAGATSMDAFTFGLD
jgi:hypothetical protein